LVIYIVSEWPEVNLDLIESYTVLRWSQNCFATLSECSDMILEVPAEQLRVS